MHLNFNCLKDNVAIVNSPSVNVKQQNNDVYKEGETPFNKLEETSNNNEVSAGTLPLVKASSEACSRDAKACKVSACNRNYYGKGKRFVFTVLNFPEDFKFKLKVNNKILSKKWKDWTTKDQAVIFKRKIKEWRSVINGKFICIPEYTEKGNLHFNLIYSTDEIDKDISITITDAYGLNHATRNIFCKTQNITDLDRLIHVYLEKTEGKQQQKTGMFWEFQNID